MPKFRVSNIQWDTDGEDVAGLPTDEVVELTEVFEDATDEAVNQLSLTYGWLIVDCTVTEV